MNFIAWLKNGLNKPGKSQRGLAAALKRDPAAINRLIKGGRELKADELAIIAAYIEEDIPQSTNIAPASSVASPVTIKGVKKVAPPNASHLDLIYDVPSPASGPRDLPILGYVKAGGVAMFIDNGTPQGVAARPDALRGVAAAYAVRVHDESMTPVLEPGFLLFVDPTRPVRPNDLVVIQLKDGQAFIKRLVRRTEKATICKQYNPATEVKYDPSEVKSVHRVVHISMIDM